MSKLEILVNVLVLVVTLAACGAVGVEPAAAAEPVIEVESAMEPRARDADFIRHNYGTKPWTAKAVVDTTSVARFERRAGDGDFLDYDYGSHPWTAKAIVNTMSVATFERRAGDGDFLGCNYGIHPWTAKVDARQPLQTQGD